MFKKSSLWMAVIFGGLLVSGCATPQKNYQGDIDSLNSRTSSLQGQLSSKDQEIARLQSEMSQQQSALAQAESEKRAMNDKLDQALSQAEANRSVSATTSTAKVESDLK